MENIPLTVSGGGTVDLSVIGGETVELSVEQVRIIYQNDRPAYTGPYNVTPELDARVLQTNNLRMTDDVVVRAIPITRTSNLYDGITVIIG